MRYTATLYLVLWNAICLSLIGVAWGYGLIQDTFTGDKSHLTIVSAALMAATIVYTLWTTFRLEGKPIDDEHHVVAHTLDESLALPIFLKNAVFLLLGLCGTLIGLTLFVKGMVVNADQANADGVMATIAAMKSSMQTAFNATLVGVVCKLWAEVIVFIMGWPVRRMHTESLIQRSL